MSDEYLFSGFGMIDLAEQSAVVTHDHPEAVRGARAVAVAIRLALDGSTPEQVWQPVLVGFGYDLREGVADIYS